MQLSVTSMTMLAEMKGSRDILDAWVSKVEEGLPLIDLPATPEQLEDFLRALCGELLIVSAKCESLSNVISGAA